MIFKKKKKVGVVYKHKALKKETQLNSLAKKGHAYISYHIYYIVESISTKPKKYKHIYIYYIVKLITGYKTFSANKLCSFFTSLHVKSKNKSVPFYILTYIISQT